ncbi:MAG TPA: AAA family ATPase [Acidimicrobiia bacterium]|jgi:DNA-binding NarL/FixJ family response regulator
MRRHPEPADDRVAFVGRDDLVASLVTSFTRQPNAPRAILVEGDAGIGKTWLVQRAADRAVAQGAIVCIGRADALSRESTLAPIVAALSSVLGDDPESRSFTEVLAQRGLTGSPVQEPIDLAGLRIEHAGDLLEARAARAPVTLAIEDVQWADVATMRALQQFIVRFADLGITVLVTRRTPAADASIELDTLLQRFSGADAITLHIPPLTNPELEQLARCSLDLPADPALMRLLAGTGGNPLYAAELLQSGVADGTIVAEHDQMVLRGAALPAALQIVLLRRTATLPSETRDVLRLASLLGTQFDADDVATLAGMRMRELLLALEPARREGIIGEIGSRLVFRHDLLRVAVYEDIPAPVRAGLHREAAAALAAEGASALTVALQFAAGAKVGDADALIWLQRAFREEMQRSVAVAVDLLLHAIALTELATESWFRLVVEALEPLTWAGRPEEAEALARRALTFDPAPATRFGLFIGLAGASSAQAMRYDDAVVYTRAARDVVGISDFDRTTAEASLAFLSVGPGSDIDADWSVALADARSAGNDAAAAIAMMAGAMHSAARGELASAFDLATKCAALHTRLGMPTLSRSNPRWLLGMLATELDEFDLASTELESARHSAEAAGNERWLPFAQVGLTVLAYARGDFEGALVESGTALALETEPGSETSNYQHVIRARIAIHRGRIEEARDHVAMLEARFAAMGPRLGFDWAMWAKALLLEYDGDGDAAFVAADTGWRLMAPVRFLMGWRTRLPDLVRLARPRDRDRALELAADAESGARVNAHAGAAATAQWCRALVEDEPAQLDAAVQALSATRRVLDTARARIDLAEALGRNGATTEAGVELDLATEIYAARSAHTELHLIAALRRDFGLSRKTRPTRPTFGWDSLTPTELEVAQMVADGLTNPQAGARLGTSRRTIETHVSHILTKLSLTSRVQLAAEVAHRHHRSQPSGATP